MRKLPFIPMILFLLLLVLPASAADRARIVGEQELAAIFREIILSHTAFPAQDLEIANFTAEPSTLTIPNGEMGYRLINQVHGEHLGGKTLRVAILVGGKEFGTIRMRGDLQLLGKVACAARALPRDTLLAEGDIEIVRRDISSLGPGIVNDAAAAIGKRLKTAMQPGKVLYSRFLEEPHLVRRGDLVAIIARAGQLEVKTPGQARGGGAQGELIRVKNLMSRKVILAEVQGPGLVQVDF